MNKRSRVIDINFASTDFRLLAAVRTALIALIAALAICAAVLAVAAVKQRSLAAEAGKRVQSLAAAEEALRPAMQEREQLVKNLAEMSAIVEARRFSWTRLLTALEGVFPAGISLTRLEFVPRERTVALEGIASSPEALSSLMIGMQRTELLRNPQLKRQSMEKGILSFNVVVNYHEPVAAPAAPAGARKPGR